MAGPQRWVWVAVCNSGFPTHSCRGSAASCERQPRNFHRLLLDVQRAVYLWLMAANISGHWANIPHSRCCCPDFSPHLRLGLHLSDPRVRGMLLLDSYLPTLALTLGYLLIVWLGPKYMKRRQPYSCRGAMMLYNLGITILSFWMFSEVKGPSVNKNGCRSMWSSGSWSRLGISGTSHITGASTKAKPYHLFWWGQLGWIKRKSEPSVSLSCVSPGNLRFADKDLKKTKKTLSTETSRDTWRCRRCTRV